MSSEPFIVAICGILKRCWEISQDHQEELQPKLLDGGELPKKSEFIEIMFSIWKDAIRILGIKTAFSGDLSYKDLHMNIYKLNYISNLNLWKFELISKAEIYFAENPFRGIFYFILPEILVAE